MIRRISFILRLSIQDIKGNAAVHLVALGLKGWMNPGAWTFGLPPISLVALVAALVPLLVKRRKVLEKREEVGHASQD